MDWFLISNIKLPKFLVSILNKLLFCQHMSSYIMCELVTPNLSVCLDFLYFGDTAEFCQKFLKYKNLSLKRQNILDNVYPFKYNLTKKLKDKFALQVANCA